MKSIIIAASVIAALALPSAATPARAEEPSTAKVLAAHLQAFGSGSVDAILANYSNDAVIIMANGTLKGKEQIRGLFQALTAAFAAPGAKFEMLAQAVEGPVAYIVWKAETAEHVYRIGSDTFVIQGGKIVHQTNVFDATKK
jgi:ketosteroid isomerase-like protein